MNRDRGEAEYYRRSDESSRQPRAAPPHPLHGRLRARGQQQREHAAEIVGLAVGHQEHHGEPNVGHAERAAPAQCSAPQQTDQAGDPDRRQVRADERELIRQQFPARRRGS